MDLYKRIIICEGLNDKLRLKEIITEPIDIVCTHGTFGIAKFDSLLEQHDLDNRDVYIFVDEDPAGIKLRKELTKELPLAKHLYIDAQYIEVEVTPKRLLALELLKHHIEINPAYLLSKKIGD